MSVVVATPEWDGIGTSILSLLTYGAIAFAACTMYGFTPFLIPCAISRHPGEEYGAIDLYFSMIGFTSRLVLMDICGQVLSFHVEVFRQSMRHIRCLL